MMNSIQQIDLRTLKKWQAQNKDFILLDVREPDEHEAFNIGGQLVPLSDLGPFVERVAQNSCLVLYCRKGLRSQLAIQRIKGLRKDLDCYNLSGGIYELM
ncbi:Rhodanese-related sulfurtransferase [Saprospira grandis DSM 2844]|uniref:Rhodanese-related sulfurtransferase n=1 Tax=Saprospira grandis DSM 2844 TaxID=694433 RepID=J1I141_9BACT|nr:rhodanese-like domain-containing protein [Saprospira grandis]EJF51983.1 Rhodanese-related sulfurtransferase [Saprospira grandis DSM 2844]